MAWQLRRTFCISTSMPSYSVPSQSSRCRTSIQFAAIWLIVRKVYDFGELWVAFDRFHLCRLFVLGLNRRLVWAGELNGVRKPNKMPYCRWARVHIVNFNVSFKLNIYRSQLATHLFFSIYTIWDDADCFYYAYLFMVFMVFSRFSQLIKQSRHLSHILLNSYRKSTGMGSCSMSTPVSRYILAIFNAYSFQNLQFEFVYL